MTSEKNGVIEPFEDWVKRKSLLALGMFRAHVVILYGPDNKPLYTPGPGGKVGDTITVRKPTRFK